MMGHRELMNSQDVVPSESIVTKERNLPPLPAPPSVPARMEEVERVQLAIPRRCCSVWSSTSFIFIITVDILSHCATHYTRTFILLHVMNTPSMAATEERRNIGCVAVTGFGYIYFLQPRTYALMNHISLLSYSGLEYDTKWKRGSEGG